MAQSLHPNFVYLEKLFPYLFNNKDSKDLHCDICQISKHTRSTFKSQHYNLSHPFSLIHSYIWGPSNVKNITETQWFLLFVDDHTHLSCVFLMKDKTETSHIFKQFHSMIETQFSTKIKVLRTDRARDYFNFVLGDYLVTHGILHQSSCVDTPQQMVYLNGKIVTYKNVHITSGVMRFLLQLASLTECHLVSSTTKPLSKT